jgi:hypothetical protein
VTIADRHATFPAASLARIVIVFVPTNSGMGAVFQLVVPVAVPEPPVELVHVTVVTPALSEAVPVKTTVAADVATFVPAGDMIVSVGGVVSFVGVVGVYVTTTVLVAVPPLFP